ncbi:hypothetical protein BDY19DRAFT_990974 [Irpex rosettiformis]|uniref:Uncharacterized protein n=1 Tax=Irpex rosettiformis TaxID=378272 RepID=A0ACB8UDF1_9APHY|nr:hypothetical protein BDY19DRAFT_990974 [Irpex rosettiformis]
MESLTNLATSLPTSNLVNAEKDLLNNFKAAALSITTLYKSSLRTSKRSYNSGYAAACQDLLLMIQQGVSAGGTSDLNGSGMTIGRVMDYLEARLDAIKSREEEEEEDEEKDKERERLSKTAPNAPSVPKAPSPGGSSSRTRGFGMAAPMTPQSPTPSVPAPPPAQPPSPTPAPSLLSRTSASMPSLPMQRNPRSRVFMNAKEAVIASSSSFSPLMSATADAPLAIIPHPTTPDMPQLPMSETVGSKRRHSAITDSSTPSVTPTASGSSRRRTRSSRNSTSIRDANDQIQSHISDAMEVEEEGRERKRVARR